MLYNFFLWLFYLIHYQGQCAAFQQGANGTIVVYGGSCIQAFLDALGSHGQIGWVFT